MPNPRHPLDWFFDELYQRDVRCTYFPGVHFDSPSGDPGWFGPGSAIWQVFGHHQVTLLALGVAAAIESSYPETEAANHDHSRVWKRDAQGQSTGRLSVRGNRVRQGHTMSFFLGCVFGPAEVAEKLCRTVRAMHGRVKGTGAGGLVYDAGNPRVFRWNYASLAWAFASTHEKYHPDPLDARGIDRFYREFTRIGEALGGTGLPATKQAVWDCLRSEFPRLKTPNHLETYQVAIIQGVEHDRLRRIIPDMFQWAILEMQPPQVQRLVGFDRGHPLVAEARIRVLRGMFKAARELGGPLKEIQEASRRANPGKPRLPALPVWLIRRRPFSP